MNKKMTTMLVVLLVCFLTLVYTLASTYAVVINVQENDGVNEIVNKITLRDLVTREDGTYNDNYYDVRNELDITDGEANLLLDSASLNENLQVVLNSIVDYRLNNDVSAKLSNDEIYDLILDGLNRTSNLSIELKNKVINKTNVYKQDISDFLYDIDVSLIG